MASARRARRFPPPWSVEGIGAAFVVIDGAGQKLSYVYYEDEPGRRSAAKLLSKNEARRIAANLQGREAQVTRSKGVFGFMSFDPSHLFE